MVCDLWWTQNSVGGGGICNIKVPQERERIVFFLTYKLDVKDFGSKLKSEGRFPLMSLEPAPHTQ